MDVAGERPGAAGLASAVEAVPRFYVAPELLGDGQCCRPGLPCAPLTLAVVRATATGAALAAVTAPRPYGTFTGVTAAAGNRTFGKLAAHRSASSNRWQADLGDTIRTWAISVSVECRPYRGNHLARDTDDKRSRWQRHGDPDCVIFLPDSDGSLPEKHDATRPEVLPDNPQINAAPATSVRAEGPAYPRLPVRFRAGCRLGRSARLAGRGRRGRRRAVAWCRPGSC